MMFKRKKEYTCSCCGYKTLDEPPGNYEICPICFWEDDPIQSEDAYFSGGANVPSLYEAQRNYKEFGACEKRFVSNVRRATKSDEKDEEWKLIEEPKIGNEVIIIDVSNVNTKEELHSILKKAFDFPDYYGMNWDAFSDCLSDLKVIPSQIKFKGWYAFEEKLFSESKLLKTELEDFAESFSAYNLKVEFYEYE